MPYIDISVMAVPTANRDAYLAQAREMDRFFRDAGASKVTETWGTDVPAGKITDFRRAVQATADEAVVVGLITWPDKTTRDAGWEQLMQNEAMRNAQMPFDGKRMIYGGFEVVLEV